MPVYQSASIRLTGQTTPRNVRLGETNFCFLICSERSGSNLISTMMACHSAVTAPPPYHLCRDIGNNLHTTLEMGTASPSWQQMKKLIVGRVMKFKSMEEAKRLALWLNAKDRISFGEIARHVYCELDGADSRPTVFIKENNLHRLLFFILQCFPGAKFVFQVRDPRDYLVSAHARKGKWLGNKFGSNRHAMDIWRADQLGGLNALAHLGSERVFFQRYEDLISNPEAVLSALCRFLGLDFEPAMLDFHKSNHAARLAEPGGPRENLNKPLIANNFGQYRQQLSKNQIKMVETYVGDLMERFGYQRDFPDTRVPGLFRVFWPQICEPVERYINGEKRPFYSDGLIVATGLAGAPLATPYARTSSRSSGDGN